MDCSGKQSMTRPTSSIRMNGINETIDVNDCIYALLHKWEQKPQSPHIRSRLIAKINDSIRPSLDAQS